MSLPSTPISDHELAELAKASETEATEDIELDLVDDDGDEFPEVEETEVTEDNYKTFLPVDDPHEINVDESDQLTDDAQAEYDETPPVIQDSYEKGDGL